MTAPQSAPMNASDLEKLANWLENMPIEKRLFGATWDNFGNVSGGEYLDCTRPNFLLAKDRDLIVSLLRASALPPSGVDRREEVATLAYEAIRFANFAAGEGFAPADTNEALDPADILFNFGKATDREDWENFAQTARSALLNAPQWEPGEPVAWLETFYDEEGGKETLITRYKPKADPSTISIEPLHAGPSLPVASYVLGGDDHA